MIGEPSQYSSYYWAKIVGPNGLNIGAKVDELAQPAVVRVEILNKCILFHIYYVINNALY